MRERILATASRLFYAEGINATGVDRISEAAGVSKRSLYQRFRSKDELVAAYLAVFAPAILDGQLPPEDDDSAPADRILAVFSAARRDSEGATFRGCPLVNAAAELCDPDHPARAVSLDYKLRMQAFFTRQAALAGAADPEALAEQLAILFDGGMAYALVRNTVIPVGIEAAAKAIVDAHTAAEATL